MSTLLGRDVHIKMADGQPPELTHRLFGVPELLAGILENVSDRDSLVPSAMVSRLWGEVATEANWQRSWIGVTKLVKVLFPCDLHITVQIVRGEIEAVPLAAVHAEPTEESEAAKHKFKLYCSKTINFEIPIGLDNSVIARLKDLFPNDLPLLPRLKKVKASSPGEWTAAAPLFLHPSIDYLEFSLRHASDQVLAELSEFRNIKQLRLSSRRRWRTVDFSRFENLQTIIADEVEKPGTLWSALAENKSLRELEIHPEDLGTYPDYPVQFRALQRLSTHVSDFILWGTSNSDSFPFVSSSVASQEASSAGHQTQSLPTFPALRSLMLHQTHGPLTTNVRLLGMSLVKLFQSLEHHAPQLQEFKCGQSTRGALPEPINSLGFRGHFMSETTSEHALNVELERGSKLGDEDVLEVAPYLGKVPEIRLTSAKREETFTPKTLALLAEHATSLKILNLRITGKEDHLYERFASLGDIDIQFDGGGAFIHQAIMVAQMCSLAPLEHFSISSAL